MSGSGFNENNWSWMDEAYDRGYKRGFADGAEKNRNAAPWNYADAKPKDEEDIMALVTPYDWRSRRLARKLGTECVLVCGYFVEGRTVDCGEYIANTPDQICVEGRKDTILWSEVLYWVSVKIPEHIVKKITRGEN